jgi:hypothetical protein
MRLSALGLRRRRRRSSKKRAKYDILKGDVTHNE